MLLLGPRRSFISLDHERLGVILAATQELCQLELGLVDGGESDFLKHGQPSL